MKHYVAAIVRRPAPLSNERGRSTKTTAVVPAIWASPIGRRDFLPHCGLPKRQGNFRQTWRVAVAYQERGLHRDASGDHIGAAEDFAHAIRVGPPNPALHYLRGVALLHADNRQAAVVAFESGLKLDPNNAALRSLVHDYGTAPVRSVVDRVPATTSR